MSTEVKRRRGTAAEHETFTGANGELTVNSTDNTVHVHDAITPGGHKQVSVPLAGDLDNAVFKSITGTIGDPDQVFPDWPTLAKVGDIVPVGTEGLIVTGGIRIITPRASGEITTLNGSVAVIGGTTCSLVGVQRRSPYIQSGFKGLKISDFVDSRTASKDQTQNVQDAVDALMEENRYTHLDLEGIHLPTRDTITVDQSGVSNYYGAKTIHSGSIAPQSGYFTDDQPAVKLTNSSGGRVERINMESMILNCNKNSSGLGIDGGYTVIGLTDLLIRDPQDYGVKDRIGVASTGNDLCMTAVKVNRTDPQTEYLNRTTRGFDIYNNDSKLSNCLATYCRTGLFLNDCGSSLISNLHVYQGSEGNFVKPFQDYTGAVILPVNQDIKISNSYIDGGPVLLLMNGGSTTKRISIDNTIFTTKDGDASYRFLATSQNVSGGYDIDDLVLTNNTFRSFSAIHPSACFGSKGSGFINTNSGNGLIIDETNKFWNVPRNLSKVKVKVNLDGSGVYSVNLSSLLAFGMNANNVHSFGFASNSNIGTAPPTAYAQRVDGKNFNLVVQGDIGVGWFTFIAEISSAQVTL